MATTFESLPIWVQRAMQKLRGDDYAEAIHNPVPALGGRSVVQVYESGENGVRELREYFGKIAGYLNIHDMYN